MTMKLELDYRPLTEDELNAFNAVRHAAQVRLPRKGPIPRSGCVYVFDHCVVHSYAVASNSTRLSATTWGADHKAAHVVMPAQWNLSKYTRVQYATASFMGETIVSVVCYGRRNPEEIKIESVATDPVFDWRDIVGVLTHVGTYTRRELLNLDKRIVVGTAAAVKVPSTGRMVNAVLWRQTVKHSAGDNLSLYIGSSQAHVLFNADDSKLQGHAEVVMPIHHAYS